ncbi:MAG TPA: nuclear transport factor 2 family protein [Pseudorhodoferax sp.]|nr:nuclear transport factor 2 family protein [Pseudorhodoferax sp.]
MSNPDASLRAEVETLLADWAHAIDSGQAESAAVLFTETAEQHLPQASAIGRAQIAEGLARRQRMAGRTTRHLFSNLRVEQDAGTGLLQAQAVLTLFRSDDADRRPCIAMVADLADRYARGADGRLRIAYRQLLPVFQAAP